MFLLFWFVSHTVLCRRVAEMFYSNLFEVSWAGVTKMWHLLRVTWAFNYWL